MKRKRKFAGLCRSRTSRGEYRTKDGFFYIEHEPTKRTGAGKGRWYIHACGRDWDEYSDDTVIGDAAGYRTKNEAVKALRRLYEEDSCHYFMTGDMEAAVGCSLNFEYTALYLQRLKEVPYDGIDQDITGILDRIEKHQQEEEELREKKNRTRERISEIWQKVFATHKMRNVQNATGHDRDE